HGIHSNGSSQPVKTFILENREVYRFFLQHWLRDQNGHQVVFFDSPEALETNGEPRDLEFLAAHLLPNRFHFKGNGNGHPHAVYGEDLDSPMVLWCRKSGVKAILDLRDRLEDWKRCLDGLGNGEVVETPSVTRLIHQGGQTKGISRLSRRESEVARMLVKGFSAKQVAASLGTSEGTVKNQRKAVYRKLGIIRATQLAGAMGYKAR
ncbi:MAG: hypothetical protein RLZZ112_198, partial [Verrucomicrobiota bacterium]